MLWVAGWHRRSSGCWSGDPDPLCTSSIRGIGSAGHNGVDIVVEGADVVAMGRRDDRMTGLIDDVSTDDGCRLAGRINGAVDHVYFQSLYARRTNLF